MGAGSPSSGTATTPAAMADISAAKTLQARIGDDFTRYGVKASN